MSLRVHGALPAFPGLRVLGVCRACGLYVVVPEYPTNGTTHLYLNPLEMASDGSLHPCRTEHLHASGEGRWQSRGYSDCGLPRYEMVSCPQDDGSTWTLADGDAS